MGSAMWVQLTQFVASAAVMCWVCLGSARMLAAFNGSVPTHPPAHGHLVVILVHDSFGVQPSEMESARKTVDTILRLVSIQIEWHMCGGTHKSSEAVDPLCNRSLTDEHLVVRFVAATPAVPSRSLGSAIVDGQDGPGVFATVYVDRVHSLASRTRVDPSLVLARVTAHEVGHLLIGTPVHNDGGLMRAKWSDRELRRNHPFDWMWSQQDIDEIARGVELRFAVGIPAPARRRSTPPAR
jgi:hypothetical protein